ncbi:MAG TPA: glutamate--tRNA ligase [Gammaproteobacteria bacterium]|nr:glutamate--tRNA ligase [Gammaproteobacteria bacterium]
MTQEVRVRFAPSPTGSLHLGGARTALYNYLLAKAMGGTYILRVEDTDQERSTVESLKKQINDLVWLGLDWDEGPDADDLSDRGDQGPYFQSKRIGIYKQYVNKLLDSGKAYYCFMTDEEQEKEKAKAVKGGKVYKVQSPYRNLTIEEAKIKLSQGEKATVRFKIDPLKDKYLFEDLIRGSISLPSDMLADFVIVRSDGMPVYNFCCVIDDHLMNISHVLRGEEHLPNTLKQLMLYETFGWTPPKYGHLSIIVGQDRKKLSKRDQAVSCSDFKDAGILPEALINYISLLGWSDPNALEVFSKDHLISAFTLERLNASSAAFDLQKLNWVNAQHLRNLDNHELWQLIESDLMKEKLAFSSDQEWQGKALNIFKTNAKTLGELVALLRLVANHHYDIEESAKDVLSWAETSPVLSLFEAYTKDVEGEYFSDDDVKGLFDHIKSELGVKGKLLFMPLRVALIGKAQGEELKDLFQLLSCREILWRVQTCQKSVVTS